MSFWNFTCDSCDMSYALIWLWLFAVFMSQSRCSDRLLQYSTLFNNAAWASQVMKLKLTHGQTWRRLQRWGCTGAIQHVTPCRPQSGSVHLPSIQRIERKICVSWFHDPDILRKLLWWHAAYVSNSEQILSASRGVKTHASHPFSQPHWDHFFSIVGHDPFLWLVTFHKPCLFE